MQFGFTGEYLMKTPIKKIIQLWLSMQDHNERENALNWVLEQEYEIDREVTSEKQVTLNGQTMTMKPKSVQFNRQLERKKRYKGLI